MMNARWGLSATSERSMTPISIRILKFESWHRMYHGVSFLIVHRYLDNASQNLMMWVSIYIVEVHCLSLCTIHLVVLDMSINPIWIFFHVLETTLEFEVLLDLWYLLIGNSLRISFGICWSFRGLLFLHYKSFNVSGKPLHTHNEEIGRYMVSF